jgi:autotransporter-associated beta strand protein
MVSGSFNFDQGTLDADNLIVALAEAGGGSTGTVSLGGGSSTFNNTTNPIRLGENMTGSGVATGTLNISGLAIVNVAASGGNSIRLGHATTAGGTAAGNLNLTGGTLTVAGDILRGANTGTSNATVKLSGGTLDMGGHDIGTLANNITLTAESGTLKNVASINGTGGITKTTAGTLVLQGANSHTGNTTVAAGTLQLADNAQLKFVIGATSGTNNRITGAGTVTLNGDFNIDTTLTDASSLTTGSWTLVDTATLTETFGSTFTITGAGWSETSNVWTKTVGSKKYTFTEATGILTLSSAASYASWIDGFFQGETNPLIIGGGADPDHDGISNGVEMVIGGNPEIGMDATLLPTLERVTNPVSTPAIPAGNYLLFTYRRSDLSVTAGVAAACETGTNLAASWTTVTGAPGVVIQVDDNFIFNPPAAAATDRVRVYVPRGSNPVMFGRLKVLVP